MAGPVQMESLNLPTGGEGGGRDMCPTNADLIEAAGLHQDCSDVVEEVECFGRAAGSTTGGELCSNVGKMCREQLFLDSMVI